MPKLPATNNPYRNALAVQDASNILGVSKSYARDLQEIAYDMRANDPNGTSTDRLAHGPVARLYLEQLTYLTTRLMAPQNEGLMSYSAATEQARMMSVIWDERYGTQGPCTYCGADDGEDFHRDGCERAYLNPPMPEQGPTGVEGGEGQ